MYGVALGIRILLYRYLILDQTLFLVMCSCLSQMGFRYSAEILLFCPLPIENQPSIQAKARNSGLHSIPQGPRPHFPSSSHGTCPLPSLPAQISLLILSCKHVLSLRSACKLLMYRDAALLIFVYSAGPRI